MASILPLLTSTRSQNKEVRTTAEQQVDLYALQAPQELFPALLQIAGDAGANIADSQSALLALKSCVLKYWSPGFEQFTGPPFSRQVRAQVREGLLQLLVSVNESKIRNACALVIGRIGSLEYPDQWPDLVEKTFGFLNNNADPLSVLGGLALFKELLLEAFREEDFMSFGEAILQRLLEIAQQPQPLNTGSNSHKILAVQSFHECVTFLLMGDDEQLPHLDQIAERMIPRWIDCLCSLLQQNQQDNELVTEIVSSIREVDSAFGKILEPLLPHIFEVSLYILESQYDNLDNELRSNYAFLLIAVLQNSGSRRSCLHDWPSVERFALLLLKLAMLSTDQMEEWLDNYNDFVTSELELDSGDLSPRTNAAALVAITGQPSILLCLMEMLQKTNYSQNTADYVGYQEAALFLIANVLSQVDLAQPLSLINMVQLQNFLSILEYSHPELEEDSSSVFQMLTARKMITASFTAKYCGSHFPDLVKQRLATHAMSYPNLASCSQLVQAAALRAFSISSIFEPEMLPFQVAGLQLIAKLIKSSEEDTPTFLAECYGSILKIDYKVVEREKSCVSVLMALAAKDSSDIDLNAQILDVVGELLDEVPSRPVVDNILKPILSVIESSMPTGFSYSGELYFSLELITTVLSHEDVEFSGDERTRMLDSFYHVITITEDPQILQVASFAYASLVKNIGEETIGEETASNVLKVAARLLKPDLDDSAALASGKLVSAIIDQFGDSLGDLLPELIGACAHRLSSAKNALLVETLVMVFCELTLRNAAAVVDILANLQMLEQVMKQWIPTFEVTIGADNIRKNIKALQLLFELNDPRLNELLLPDEPIKKPGEVITRRKAKNLQFTQVSAPVKILKLLIRELSQAPVEQQQQQPGQKGVGNTGESSDDEWDDELVITEEGEFFDQIAYNLILNWFKKLGQQPGMVDYFMKLNEHERNILIEATK